MSCSTDNAANRKSTRSGCERSRSRLGVKARIKAALDVSFGLGLASLAVAAVSFVNVPLEVLMNNANAFVACVWCGVSLLRGPVVVKPQPRREAL